MTETSRPPKTHFNPNQVEILDFVQIGRPLKDGARSRESDLKIRLGSMEANGPQFTVGEIELTVAARGLEPVTQYEAVRLFLDAVMRALQREKEGIRPGSP